jgi:alanine dehydrogenase
MQEDDDLGGEAPCLLPLLDDTGRIATHEHAPDALVLDDAAVRRRLQLDEIVPAMERALADFSAGRVQQPVRTVVPVPEHGGFLYVMPAYAGALGVKLVTVFPQNQDIPTHQATVVLFRPQTGQPLASMAGDSITEMRTAAASAVATKLLARPDATVLAILGAGVQARGHLRALRLVRELREVRVWSPHNAAAFAREHGVHAAGSAREAVEGADIVVTATTATEPVLQGAWLKPGAHITSVGAPRPEWRELDDETLRRATIYVDSRAAASSESGDIIAAGRVDAEIGEVVLGVRPGRRSADEITLFKSLGMAVEDVVTAEMVYRKAISEPMRRE